MVRRGPVAFAIGGEMEEIGIDDVEEIDTIIAELEISKGKGNLILCVVNAPVYRDRIIRVLEDRFTSKVIIVERGEDIIQTLKDEDLGNVEILIWSMPEKLTEDLADTLNNFRELFYDARIPNLVFLSQSVLDDVIRRAPDFWRYRGNYYELKGAERGRTFEALDALATSLHYQNKEDLLRRKRINEYLLEKVRDQKETAKILDELGNISYNLGEYGSALEYYKKELKVAQELDDKSSMARSMHNLGMLAQDTGDIGEARRLYGESLKIAQELGDKRGISRLLHQMAMLAQNTGDIDEARRLYGESLKIFQELGDKRGVASSLHNLGALAQDAGEIEEARRLYGESLKIKRELGDKSGVSKSLHQMGTLAQDAGEIEEARRLYGESLKIAQELGDKSGVATSLARSALLEEMEGNLEKALDLICKAETMFLELKSPMAVQARKDKGRLEQKVPDK